MGTPNKVTSELRKTLKGIIANELNALPDMLASLPARERIELAIKLLLFCMPMVNTINSSYDSNWNAFDDE
jgi:hypothetical protein